MEPLAQLTHLASLGPLATDTTRNGRVWGEFRGLPLIRYTVTPADVARLKRGLELCMELLVAAGARRLYPGVLGDSNLEPRRGLNRFRKTELSASDIVLASYHPLGTCEMGTDARTSVVGLDHQSHDLPGLFIVDGSTVRGPLGVNPQLTIMAMAVRARTSSPQLRMSQLPDRPAGRKNSGSIRIRRRISSGSFQTRPGRVFCRSARTSPSSTRVWS